MIVSHAYVVLLVAKASSTEKNPFWSYLAFFILLFGICCSVVIYSTRYVWWIGLTPDMEVCASYVARGRFLWCGPIMHWWLSKNDIYISASVAKDFCIMLISYSYYPGGYLFLQHRLGEYCMSKEWYKRSVC